MNEFHQRDVHHKRIAIANKNGKPLNVGGIWENWRAPGASEWERTCAIITVKSSGPIAARARMPLVIGEANVRHWLEPESDPRNLLMLSSDIGSALTVLP